MGGMLLPDDTPWVWTIFEPKGLGRVGRDGLGLFWRAQRPWAGDATGSVYPRFAPVGGDVLDTG